MKNNKLIIGLMVLFLTLGLTGCEEDEIIAPDVAVGSFDVDAAFPGDPVSITGDNFNTVQFLFVGNKQAPFQLDGNTISFVVPEDAVIGQSIITFAMANNYRVNANFEVLLRPVPVIKSISPSAALEGEEVTISGTSLNNLETITIGGVEATVVSSTADQLVVTVPAGLPLSLPAEIEIVTSGGETASESIFYVGDNLLANGEFELGDGDDFTNWSKFNGGDGMTATTADGEAYSGRSMRVVGAGADAWRTQLASDAATTQVGVEYTLTMWIKAEAGSPGDGGNIRFSTTPEAMYSGNYDITSEWQQIQWIFNANVDGTQVVLDMGVVQDAIYFIDNVTLIETGAAGPQPTEVLLNGGFELGDGDDFTNWSKFNGADLLTATTVADEVHSGSRALRAVGAGADAWRTQMASDVVMTDVGVEYMVSLWIKGEAGSPGDGGSVRMSTAGNGDAQYQASFTVTTDWQKIEWLLTANGTETQIVLDMGATENAVYFVDDLSVLEPPKEPAPNLALNGDMELGDGDEFTNWSKYNGADLLTATTVSDEVHDGSRALRAVGAGADAWRTQFASDVMATEVGVVYTASLWIKGEAGSPGDGGSVRMSTAGNGDAQYQASFTVTTDWQQVEWEITGNGTETNLVLDLGATENAVYFVDDIEFKEN